MESTSSSRISISGYSLSPMRWTAWRKSPSTSFTILALVTTVTLCLPFLRAKSKAARAMRSAPGFVQTLKSMASSSPTRMPRLPRMYSPSMFSRKKVQSMPLSGMRMGRTAAKSWSSLLSRLLAETRLGRPSPARGVMKGPLTSTSHSLQAARTSSGRLCILATRFSMVMPSMVRNSILPEATSSLTSSLATRRACSIRTGPVPSPGMTPTTIFSSLE